MAIKENRSDGVAVLAPKGKLMGGPDSFTLHDKVHSLIDDGIKQVVIDLAKVKWVNSSGLGTLMACLTTLRNADGELKLANVSRKIESLLLITKLIAVFETYDSVNRAVASFSK
jgi:anti-sigma B factor antagonist